MPTLDLGYKKDFLGKDTIIDFPKISNKKDVLPVKGKVAPLDYIHFSLFMSKARRLAYFTAVNIDGTKWQDNARVGTFKNEPKIKAEEQLGDPLYKAKKSDFDKGHLVKREDPEWGDKALSKKAGTGTFVFTNCAPQHKKLNREIWQELENNILHTGAVGEDFRINLFTGPVLSYTDGEFVTAVGGEHIKIPNLFWKVVVWKKKDKKTYAVGFMQSQEKFLLDGGIIKKPMKISALRTVREEDIFEHLEFKDGNTYQVPIEQIEKLAGLSFDWKGVIRPFNNKLPKMIMKTAGGGVPRLSPEAIRFGLKRAPGTLLTGMELG
jgi:endonuclease G